MMVRSLAVASLSLLLLAACGGSVVVDGTGSGGSSGTGTGGAVAAGGGGCVGSIDLAVNNAPASHLTSLCSSIYNPTMATTPIGYFFAGGPVPGVEGFEIDGCAKTGPEALELSVSNVMAAGTFTEGSAQYTTVNGAGLGTNGLPIDVVILQLGAVGQAVEGTFGATVFMGPAVGGQQHLSGSFHVCRVADYLAP